MPLALPLVMANIQVKNVPEKLHNQLRRYAREQDCNLGEIIFEAIAREMFRWEWHKRFSRRSSTQLRILGLSCSRKNAASATLRYMKCIASAHIIGLLYKVVVSRSEEAMIL